MKNIETIISEQKSGSLISELDNLVKEFCNLWEKTQDYDKEMLCKELICRTVEQCNDSERAKKAWKYCSDEIIPLWDK